MKAVTKKLLSLLVAVMMLVSVVPFAAMADNGDPATISIVLTQETDGVRGEAKNGTYVTAVGESVSVDTLVNQVGGYEGGYAFVQYYNATTQVTVTEKTPIVVEGDVTIGILVSKTTPPATSKTITVNLIKELDGVDTEIPKTYTTTAETVNIKTLIEFVDANVLSDGYTFVRYNAGSGRVESMDDITVVDGMNVNIRVAKTTPPDDGGDDDTQLGDGTGTGDTVKFVVDGVEYATIQQTEGQTAVLPATPYKTGYDFEGWYSMENGQGHRIYNGVNWYGSSYARTYYAHFVSNKVVDNNTIRVFVQGYVGDVLRFTREIDSVQLETGENAFNWLYYNKDRIDGLIDAAYPGYTWNPQLYYDYSGKEPLTEQNLVANGTKSVCVKIYSDVEANVLLYVHRGSASATPAIYEMPGYIKDDTVSRAAVETLVKKHYTGKNMTLQGLYNDEAWQDLLEGKSPTAANGVKVTSNGTVRIHIILKNASASTADPTNPKTGDYVLPTAMTVMVLSAVAAAAVYVVDKKRRA